MMSLPGKVKKKKKERERETVEVIYNTKGDSEIHTQRIAGKKNGKG